MDEFRTLPLASQSVQNFVAFTTRRASIAEFYKSCIALVEFLDVFLQEPEQLYPDFNERHALLEHLRTIRFSFATIHQCISKRRFPTNFSQLWPYLGIPIREVSQNLGVSVSVLKSRCIELRKKWPKPSNTYRVLVAVQVFVRHLGRVNARKLFRLRKRLTLKQIHIRLRYQFEISEEMRSFLYCEIKGRRYGPLRNSQQWVEVLGHDDNDYRVNLLLVVSEQRNTQNQRQQLENVQLAPSSADVAPAPEVTNSAQNRTRTLMGALHQSNYGANPLKNSTCLTFSTTFTEVQGRVLEPPKLKFGWRVLDMVQSIKGFAYDGEKTLFTVGHFDRTIIEFPVVLENLSSNRTKAIFDALQGHELEQFNEAVRVLDAAKQGWFLVRQCFFHNDPKNSIGIDGGVVGFRDFHSSLLGLISQIVKIQLLASVDFKKTPELAEMVEDSKEAEELMGLAPEKVLLKWMNYQLKKAGYKKEVTNFSSDLKDGEAYAHLLNVLAPEHGSTKTLETKDPTERANLIIEQAEKLDCKRYVTSKDIVEGSTNLNLAFVAQIFHHRNGLTIDKSKCSFAEMMSDDESTSREERCFRMWIKKLIIAFLWQLMRFSMLQLLRNLRTHGQGKEINDADILQWANMKVKQCGKTKKDSFKDKRLSDGIFFLELLSAVQKRVVNWGLVTKGETFLVEITDEDKKLNAMYIISVARKLGCSIFLLLEDILESLHEPYSVIEVNYAPVGVDMFDTIKRALPGPPLFLLCILPERKNSDIYGPWKRKCLVDFGIVTQCNLLLKINAKMGGTNSLLYDEYLHSIPLVSRTPTIIFNMDASIAAAVSSRQWPLISRYGASVRAQSARVEMIDGLFKPVAGKVEEMIRALLDDYYTSTEAASEDAFRLVVPEYKAKEQLQERLLLAIH